MSFGILRVSIFVFLLTAIFARADAQVPYTQIPTDVDPEKLKQVAKILVDVGNNYLRQQMTTRSIILKTVSYHTARLIGLGLLVTGVNILTPYIFEPALISQPMINNRNFTAYNPKDICYRGCDGKLRLLQYLYRIFDDKLRFLQDLFDRAIRSVYRFFK